MPRPVPSKPARRQIGRRPLLGLLIAAGAAPLAPAAAQTLTDPNAVVRSAERTVSSIREGRSGDIIGFLLGRAVGAMVFPRLIRVGFILGGEGGNGVLLARDEALGWSYPAFTALGAGSVGLQIGAQSTRALLIIMDPATLRRAVATNLRLGVDASVAVGPEGLTREFTTQTAFEEVYSFTETEGGLYVGASLDGAVIGIREALNEAYYGRKIDAAEIIFERQAWNAQADGLLQALQA